MSEKQKKISSTKKINKNTSPITLGQIKNITVIVSSRKQESVDQVAKEAASMSASAPTISALNDLASDNSYLTINNLRAGYGKMEILHDFNLQIGKGQSLCLIGPNGAGKSTVLHSIFGFTNIFSGSIVVDGLDVTP